MEVLGCVASVFAVVSLALEVAKIVRDTYEICRGIKEAPQEIIQLADQLHFLNQLLTTISGVTDSTGEDNVTQALPILHSALQRCRRHVSLLNEFLRRVQGSDTGKKASRVKRSLKAFFTRPEAEKLGQDLQTAIQALVLALLATQYHARYLRLLESASS